MLRNSRLCNAKDISNSGHAGQIDTSGQPPQVVGPGTRPKLRPIQIGQRPVVLPSKTTIMSSFKRKVTGQQIKSYPGTRYSPASPSIVVTSTGIPSLDDLLGGGLPLSCSMLVAAPDLHSSYGELIQKYFIAEGLASSQKVLIVDHNARSLLRDLMWIPKYSAANENQEDENQDSQKVKIAWRYEKLKQFQTTVDSYASLIVL